MPVVITIKKHSKCCCLCRRYGVALVGIKQNVPNASIQLNPGSRHIMKATDICFYMSITKEENSGFILAHPNEDKESLFTRHGSIKALARAGSYRYSKVTSIVATVGKHHCMLLCHYHILVFSQTKLGEAVTDPWE